MEEYNLTNSNVWEKLKGLYEFQTNN